MKPPIHVPPDRVVDFDMYAPPALDRGFQESWAQLQQEVVPDLVWTPHNGGHWIAVRARVIQDVLATPQTFSSRVAIVPKASGELYHTMPLTVDPPAHRHYRNLLNVGLAPKSVRALEPRIRETAASLIEALRERGACDFTREFAEIFPVRLFLAMVDLPASDADHLQHLMQNLTRPDGTMTFGEAMDGFYDYLGPIVDARLGGNGVDLLSEVINGQVCGRAVTRQEALELGNNLLMGGVDTVVNFLGFVMLSLARDGQQRQALAADPSLVAAAVEEYLRRFPIVTLAREVAEDVHFQDVEMKKGEMIVLPTVLHGLDPGENRCPMQIDFHRATREHSTFGSGIHKCAGAQLARTEVRIVIEEWLTRIPDFEVDPGASITFQAGTIGCVTVLPLVWDASSTAPKGGG